MANCQTYEFGLCHIGSSIALMLMGWKLTCEPDRADNQVGGGAGAGTAVP